MGIPKFYRYLSERYPLINEVVTSSEYLPHCDYLYLDLNGIIHNATHGNSAIGEIPTTDQVASYVMGYISHIFKQIQPKKLMFIAVDGVAPRAKLNQQRSRRFRTVYDRCEELELTGYTGEIFDSNCITPGTSFMAKVDLLLEYFIRKKISEDPLWRSTKILYSSHSCPGEGEHKIMEFIRYLCTTPGYNASERHCIYGLDADLILLSLSLHDVNFILFREVINFLTFMKHEEIDDRIIAKSKWEVLHVSLLRNYLLNDLLPKEATWITEEMRERLLDDFVLIMILLGNDFVPELPSLDIGEGSIQFIIDTYQSVISETHSFFVDNAQPVIPALHLFFAKVGGTENAVFANREEQAKSRHATSERMSSPPDKNPEKAVPGGLPVIKSEAYIRSKLKKKANNYRDHYYFAKLNIMLPEHESILQDLCKNYYEGLYWVCLYYYRGIPSWSWYYRYHYSPLASDLAKYNMEYESFNLDQPFTPFMQQLACLPPQSSPLLPRSYRVLVQEGSPVADFYPETFSIDMNNKRNPWEGVNLIPFIDVDRLIQAIHDLHVDDGLTDEERKRNAFGALKLYQYDPNGRGSYVFPFESVLFKPISRLLCSVQVTAVGEASRPQESVLRLRPLPDTSYIDFTICNTSMEYLRIVTTGRYSKYPTTVVTIPPRIQDANLTHNVLKKLGANALRRVVKYPPWSSYYGVVMELFTKRYTVRKAEGKNGVAISVNPPELVDKLQRVMMLMLHDSLEGRPSVLGLGGINLSEVNIIAVVLPITGLKRERMSGKLRYKYNDNCILLPLQLIQPVSKITNPHYMLSDNRSIMERMKKGDNVVFLGDGAIGSHSLQGAVGCIEGIKDGLVTVKLSQLPLIKSPQKLMSTFRTRWYTSIDLAEILKIPRRAVEMMVSRYMVQSSQEDRNIGMNWVRREYVNPRYAQCVPSNQRYISVYSQPLPHCPLAKPYSALSESDSSWKQNLRYTPHALRTLKDLRDHFPEVFNRMTETDCSTLIEELFMSHKELEAFCSYKEKSDEIMMDKDSQCVTTEQAEVFTKWLDVLDTRQLFKPIRVRCCPELLAFWEPDSSTISPTEIMKVVPMIGDRFVVIGGNDAPFGSYGVVLAVHPKTHYLEAVMDHPFIGGTDLYGLLSCVGRGAVLTWEDCFFLKVAASFEEAYERMQVEKLLCQLRDYLKLHRIKSDDLFYVIRQDDVDSFINCVSKKQISLMDTMNSLEQGVFHLAAEFDSIGIVKYLFQQHLLLTNEDAMGYTPYDTAFENKSIRVLLFSILQMNDKYLIINELMNRFSLFIRDGVSYDSIVIISKNRASKQFATNLSLFNAAYRHVTHILSTSKAIYFVDNNTLYTSNSLLTPSTIYPLSIADPVASVEAGKHNLVALTTNGSIYISSAINRQVSDSIFRFSKVNTDDAVIFSHIACGNGHFAALSSAGVLFMWGDNQNGQIPDVEASTVDSPIPLSFSNVDLISCYGNHTCVVCSEGVFYWPSFRPGRGEASRLHKHPMQVNTMYHLHLAVVQIMCHDGFNTILTAEGRLYGFYYYPTQQCVRTAAARALFPESLDPGCIYALLPSINISRVFAAKDGCIAQSTSGQMYYLGIKKTYAHLHIANDSRIETIGGRIEICNFDDSGTLFGRCRHIAAKSCSDDLSSLKAFCAKQLMDSLRIEQLPQVFAAIRGYHCTELIESLQTFILDNIVEISLYYPSVLSDCFEAVSLLPCQKSTSILPSFSSDRLQEISADSVKELIEEVYKRMRSLRKRIEKTQTTVSQLSSKSLSISDFQTIESRQTLITEFNQYVDLARQLLTRSSDSLLQSCLDRLQWISQQTIPNKIISTPNPSAAPPKKKKRSKKPVEAPVEKETAPVEEEKRPERSNKGAKDDGFVTVRKGRIAASFSSGLKTVSPSMFEESEEEPIGIDDEVAAGAMIEDDEWSGLSQEEIRNQKILLEYYKMQQEKREKRKQDKPKKGRKRFIVC